MPDEAGGICNSNLQHMKWERDGEMVKDWVEKKANVSASGEG